VFSPLREEASFSETRAFSRDVWSCGQTGCGGFAFGYLLVSAAIEVVVAVQMRPSPGQKGIDLRKNWLALALEATAVAESYPARASPGRDIVEIVDGFPQRQGTARLR
jgi:hypothetical protein